MNRCRQKRGFTLLELLIVILILGIATALAAPQVVASWSLSKLDAAAGEVVGALQYAQARAISSGATWRVTFDVTAESFQVEQSNDPNLATILNPANATIAASVVDAPVTAPVFTVADSPQVPGTPYRINVSTGPNNTGIAIASAAFGGSGTTVTFTSKGTPVEGGTVTLSHAGVSEVVQVNGVNGLITVK